MSVAIERRTKGRDRKKKIKKDGRNRAVRNDLHMTEKTKVKKIGYHINFDLIMAKELSKEIVY